MSVNYKGLWKILIDKDMKKKDLQALAQLSSSSIAKLSKNKHVSMAVLEKICRALNVDIGQIIEIDDININK